jgi:hypothetical protein
MPEFTSTGTKKHDLWLVDNSKDFAWFPDNLLDTVTEPAPIRLHVGDFAFGQVHIDNAQGRQAWLQKLKTNTPTLVWEKLQFPAQVYLSDKLGALKLSFRHSPEAVMVLEWRTNGSYFSVVTIYSHPTRLDGQSIGRYRPSKPPTNKLILVNDCSKDTKEKAGQ